MSPARRAALWLTLCLLVGHFTAIGRTAAAEPSLRRSDVVFMYDDPKQYEAYGCTVLGWAGSADPRRVEAAHAKGVRLFCSSVGFLTEFSRVIDFSRDDFLDAACRDFEGKPFVVPWLWDHKYKEQPAWWWCTNSPLYRRYLESRIERMMKAPLDGLHIDDYRGTSGAVTWRSAGFCRHCMAGFREYLQRNVPKEKLVALGITDLAKFDYRQFLVDRGVTPEQYRKERGTLPLAAEFLDFQVKADNAYVAQYRKRAEELRGQPLALCVNSNITDPHALMIAPQLTFFCCEVGHDAAARKLPLGPVYAYKLADGVRRPVASTASGQDWAYVAEHKVPGLVRTWIALSYAMGHHFMAPHRQWCYTEKKGTHWYTGPAEEYAYLYQFVRQNARLLDGYEAAAPVAVVYDNAARRRGRADIKPICTALADKNIPFTVVAAGDDWLDYRLDPERLKTFKAVILAGEFAGDDAQRKAIEQARTAGRLVRWPDAKRLEELVPAPVTVEGTSDVLAVPRAIPGDASAPLVLHLVNRRYDGRKDAMIPQGNFTLRLRSNLLAGRKFTKAVLHAPKTPAQTLEVRTHQGQIIVGVPGLVLWGIVELFD
jgi:hypothetical protein